MKVVKECYHNQSRCLVSIASYIYMHLDSCVNDDDNRDHDYDSNDDDRPSDRVQKKNEKLCGNFRQYYAEVSDYYAEKTADYAEISELKKLFPWLFQTNKKLVNVLPRN